jgi:DnaK suppressor protein
MGRVAEDDQAQISHDEFVSLRMNGLDYNQLRLVEEALDRLDTGDYGVCLACDEPIAEKRLRALPWARYCVTCQDLAGLELDAYREPVGKG